MREKSRYNSEAKSSELEQVNQAGGIGERIKEESGVAGG